LAVSGGRDERGDDGGKRVGARMQRVRVCLLSATRRGLAAGRTPSAAPAPSPAAASEHSSLPPPARACRRAVGGRRLAGWDAKRAGPPRRATRPCRTPPPTPPPPPQPPARGHWPHGRIGAPGWMGSAEGRGLGAGVRWGRRMEAWVRGSALRRSAPSHARVGPAAAPRRGPSRGGRRGVRWERRADAARQGRREEGKEGEQRGGGRGGISTLQSRKLEGQSDCGYGGEGRQPCGEKKKLTDGGALPLARASFLVHQSSYQTICACTWTSKR